MWIDNTANVLEMFSRPLVTFLEVKLALNYVYTVVTGGTVCCKRPHEGNENGEGFLL